MTPSHIPVNKIFVLEKKISSFLKCETEKFRLILVHVYYFVLSVKVCLISSAVSENSVGRTSKCSLQYYNGREQ